jgi:hypothetical protein
MGNAMIAQAELSLIYSRPTIDTQSKKQKPRGEIPTGFLKNLAVPTFALVGTIIGLKSLTTVFGMGTGVSFSVCSPEEDRRTVRHGDLNLDGCKSGAGENRGRGRPGSLPFQQFAPVSCVLKITQRAFDKCGQAIVR